MMQKLLLLWPLCLPHITNILTISQSSEVSEHDGHVEVDTEAKEQRAECHTDTTAHEDALLAVLISQPAPEVTARNKIFNT